MLLFEKNGKYHDRNNRALHSTSIRPCRRAVVGEGLPFPRGMLSNKERKAYTDAVLCLQAKTGRTPTSLIPGVKSRFDDFVGTHINQTLNIHYTVSSHVDACGKGHILTP